MNYTNPKQEYKVRKTGGTAVLTVPNNLLGKRYTRAIWPSGKIVFSPAGESNDRS